MRCCPNPIVWQGCHVANVSRRDDDHNRLADCLVPRPALYVKQSHISGAGGGLFSGRVLAANEYLATYKGVPVKATTLRAPGYARGYIMRVGPRYIDGRDLDCGRVATAR